MQRMWEAMDRPSAERFHEELKKRNYPVDLGAAKAFVREVPSGSSSSRPQDLSPEIQAYGERLAAGPMNAEDYERRKAVLAAIARRTGEVEGAELANLKAFHTLLLQREAEYRRTRAAPTRKQKTVEGDELIARLRAGGQLSAEDAQRAYRLIHVLRERKRARPEMNARWDEELAIVVPKLRAFREAHPEWRPGG